MELSRCGLPIEIVVSPRGLALRKSSGVADTTAAINHRAMIADLAVVLWTFTPFHDVLTEGTILPPLGVFLAIIQERGMTVNLYVKKT